VGVGGCEGVDVIEGMERDVQDLEAYPSSFNAGTFQAMLWGPAVMLALFLILRTGAQPLSTLEGRWTRKNSSIVCV
jgi:hypothetical protein